MEEGDEVIGLLNMICGEYRMVEEGGYLLLAIFVCGVSHGYRGVGMR